MKVKIFDCKSYQGLEKKINDFLSENERRTDYAVFYKKIDNYINLGGPEYYAVMIVYRWVE